MEVTETLWVLAVMLFAALVQAVGGFGFALMAVPLAAIAVDLELAVIAVSIGSLFNVTMLCVRTIRQVDREVAVRFNVAAFLGMPIGLAVLELTPQRPLKISLGVVIVIATFALMRGSAGLRTREGGRPTPRRWIELAAGAISGVLSTATGTNGPPLVLALQMRKVSPEVFRATLAFTFAVSGAISMALFVGAGMVTRHAVFLAAMAVPLIVVGQRVGLHLQSQLSEKRFDRLVYVLLFVSGISVAASGLIG